ELGVPDAFALRWDGAVDDDGGDGAELLAAWTDDRRVTAVLTSSGSAGGAPAGPVSVTVTDLYGAVRTLEVPPGGVPVELTGAPQYLTAPAGTGLTLAPAEPYGPDLLEGAAVTASSTADGTSTVTVTDGTTADPEP